MSTARTVSRILPAKRVTDGAGVPVRRTLGDSRLQVLDPFLLMDEFKASTEGDIDAGMPTHPHRGIETITYVLSGQLRVRNTSGADDLLTAGGVQWTTAASGVIHEEMPVPGTSIRAIQFWLNLPRAEKMLAPRIQVLAAHDIPMQKLPGGVELRVIAGVAHGVTGPIGGGSTRPGLVDVLIPPNGGLSLDIAPEKVAMVYVLEGQGMFGITGTSTGEMVGRGHLIVLSAGDAVKILAGQQGTRFLVLAARPIGEPICRYGPMVMTTPDEIELAVNEFHDGTFVRHLTQPE